MRKNILFDMEGTLVDGPSAIEGIREVLLEMRDKGYRLFVVTSAHTSTAQQKLRALDFAHFFEQIYGSDLDGREHSKRDVITYALRRHDLVPEETSFIGDSDSDIFGARYNSILSIGVTWGFGSLKDFARAGADYVVESPEQIIPLLETLSSIEKKKAANS